MTIPAGYKQVWIQSASVLVNESTGAILIDTQPLTLLAGPQAITVDATSGGKALTTLLGSAIHAGLKRLVLIPAAAGVYWAAGSASSSSAPLPSVGISIPIDKTAADTLKFYAANVAMTVLQFG